MTTDLAGKPGLIPVTCISLRSDSAPISTIPAHALSRHQRCYRSGLYTVAGPEDIADDREDIRTTCHVPDRL